MKAIVLHQACVLAGEAAVNDGSSGRTLATGIKKSSTGSISVAATVLRC